MAIPSRSLREDREEMLTLLFAEGPAAVRRQATKEIATTLAAMDLCKRPCTTAEAEEHSRELMHNDAAFFATVNRLYVILHDYMSAARKAGPLNHDGNR